MPTESNVPAISKAPAAQQGAENVANIVKAWKQYRFGDAQTPREYLQAYGGVDLQNPDKPVQSEIDNPKHTVAKLVSQLMPKVYKYLEDYPNIKVHFDWLPDKVARPTDQTLGVTFAQPGKQMVRMEAIHPYNMYKQLQKLAPEQQAQYLRFYKSTIPHEIRHVLDILKQHRLTGVLANVPKLQGAKSTEAAKRLMEADPGLKDLYHGSLTHYFGIFTQMGKSNSVAMDLAKDMALNEVAVQAGADTAGWLMYKNAAKAVKAAEEPVSDFWKDYILGKTHDPKAAVDRAAKQYERIQKGIEANWAKEGFKPAPSEGGFLGNKNITGGIGEDISDAGRKTYKFKKPTN